MVIKYTVLYKFYDFLRNDLRRIAHHYLAAVDYRNAVADGKVGKIDTVADICLKDGSAADVNPVNTACVILAFDYLYLDDVADGFNFSYHFCAVNAAACL